MADSIRRVAFIQEFQGRSLRVDSLRAQSGLGGVDVAGSDANANGVIDTPEELNDLFTKIDAFDGDGDRNSFNNTGRVAQAMTGMRAVAATTAAPTSPYRDIALARTFTTRLSGELQKGASGPRIVALQYALDRLGLMTTRIDGKFGNDTYNALRAFQTAHPPLAVTGRLNHDTLAAIDAAVATLDARTPAEIAATGGDAAGRADRALRSLLAQATLTPMTPFVGTPVNWNNPSVQEQYSRFVHEFWPTMRANRLEMDCKTVSLMMVECFQRYTQQQLGVTLPMPHSGPGSLGNQSLPDAPWTVFTNAVPRSLFQRVDHPPVRPGYESIMRVQDLDPTFSMLNGANFMNDGLFAHDVAMTVRPLGVSTNNGGDRTRPEIDISLLRPGDMILFNHNKLPQGSPPGARDTHFDHCVTVSDVQRDGQGRVTSVTLAVAAFDDIRDADSSTLPAGLPDYNMYMEECVISFNTAGRITGSRTTWSSESRGMVNPRYNASNLLMELNPGGTIFAGRWGS